MALNADKAKLFVYICDIEVQTAQTKIEVLKWLRTQAERRVVLFKDQDGKTTGGLIDLGRKLCSEYLDTGSCHPPDGYCALWHVCKRFLEGNCEGECGRSHNFLDKGNQKHTIEAGLRYFPDQLIRNIVAYSLPQVCLRYSNSAKECKINACPYLHICPSVVRKTACECSLSHSLVDRHNKKILERYNLSDCHLSFESEKLIAFVLCNILHPFRQEIYKPKGKNLKYTLRSNLTSLGCKTTSEFLTSRKGEVSSIPQDPGSLDLQGSNSTSHASSSGVELITSKVSSVSPNPTSVTTKQTGLLQECPTEVMCSNRSDSSLTFQDSRSFSELHTLKPDAPHCPERLSSNEVISLERSNQTSGLSASKLTSQDSRSIPGFHSLKDDELFRPETEKREKMEQETAFKRHFPSTRMSYTSTTRSKGVSVQYRSLRGLPPISLGCKTTSEFLTSRKGEVSSIPPDPGSLDLQGSPGNSTSHASSNGLKLLTSRASSVSTNPTSVTTKQTDLLQECPSEVKYSNRSDSSLTFQDSRSFSELHTLKPDAPHCPDPEKRRRMIHENLKGQVPSLRLSSNEVINLEWSNQTSGLSASKLTLQDSRSIPGFHTSKDDALFRPETEKREKMEQETAFKRNFPSTRMSYSSKTLSKGVSVQYRSLRGLSTVQEYLGVPSKDDRIPDHWSSEASDTNYARVKVEPGSSEIKEVETLFRKTMKEDKIIVSFERVENLFLWEKYSRKKKRMVTLTMLKNPQSVTSDIHIEKRLFHGTSPDVVDAICKQNFDWRVCGKSGTNYGQGSYFATNASYSHSYAKSGSGGSRFMFLAKVLVGSFIKGKPEYRRPPNKERSNPSSDLYDSCVDNEYDPKIFVIFESDQFYPEYVIEYFTLDEDQILLTPPNFQERTTKSAGIIKSPIPHRALTGSASNLQKPSATNLRQSLLAWRRSQGLKANPWRPSTSSSADRASSHSATNWQQPLPASRSSQDLKANPKSPSTSLGANSTLSHSASNSQQLIASQSSQDLKANPSGPSTSLSATRAPSHSATNSQQPLPAARSSQDLKANPKSPSTSLGADSTLSHYASNSQQLIASQSSQDLKANPSAQSTSLSATRAPPHSATNSQQPLPAARSSQDLKANPKSPSTSLGADSTLSHYASNSQQLIASQSSQDLKANPSAQSTSLSATRVPPYSATNSQQPLPAARSSQDLKANPKSPSTSLGADSTLSHYASNSQQLIASQSSQDLKANPSAQSTSLSATRVPPYSATNSQQPLPAARSSQDLKANPKSPSTSLGADSTLSHYASNSQQLIASQSSQDLKANPSAQSTSLSATRAPPHSATNLQQPIKASKSSQGGASNIAGSSDTVTASDSNARSRKKQRNDSKLKCCLIL